MSSHTIPDGGRNRLRDKGYAPFYGFGLQRPKSHPEAKLSNLGACLLLRAPRGSHHGGVRCKEAVRLRESGGRSARGTGMMAGSDGAAVAGGLARHRPVLARPALEHLNVRDGGIYIDGT